MSGRRRSGTRTFIYILLFILVIALVATGVTFLVLFLLPSGSTGGQTGLTGLSGASFVASTSLLNDASLNYDGSSLNGKTVQIQLKSSDKSLAVSGGCGISVPTIITTSTKLATDIRDRWKLSLVPGAKATFYLIPTSACVPLKLSAFTCGNTNGTYLASINDVSTRRNWQITPTQPSDGTYQIKLATGARGSCSEVYLTGASNAVLLSASASVPGWTIVSV